MTYPYDLVGLERGGGIGGNGGEGVDGSITSTHVNELSRTNSSSDSTPAIIIPHHDPNHPAGGSIGSKSSPSSTSSVGPSSSSSSSSHPQTTTLMITSKSGAAASLTCNPVPVTTGEPVSSSRPSSPASCSSSSLGSSTITSSSSGYHLQQINHPTPRPPLNLPMSTCSNTFFPPSLPLAPVSSGWRGVPSSPSGLSLTSCSSASSPPYTGHPHHHHQPHNLEPNPHPDAGSESNLLLSCSSSGSSLPLGSSCPVSPGSDRKILVHLPIERSSLLSGSTTTWSSHRSSIHKSSPWTTASTSSGVPSREEDIYEDLCYVNLRIGTKGPSIVSKAGGDVEDEEVPSSIWPVGMLGDQRDYCVKELVETEKNYIDALHMIVRFFLRPLKPILPSKDRKTIFLHIKELGHIHRSFHQDLVQCCTGNFGSDHHRSNGQLGMSSSTLVQPVTSTTTLHISQCFLSVKDRLVVYGSYCANLPQAQVLVDDYTSRQDDIAKQVHHCQKEANDGKFKLRDLLSLPMQRILKYHLLLSQLIKYTNPGHADYNGLTKAHEAMLDLGHYINEIKRDSETLTIVSHVEKSITDLDMPDNTHLKDYGRLLKDGEVKLRSTDSNKLKCRYIFLFDRVMLMCKPVRGDTYSYREALILSDFRVMEMVMPTTTGGFLHNTRTEYGWLMCHKSDMKNVYGFMVKSCDLRDSWVTSLIKAQGNVFPPEAVGSDHNLVLSSFPNPCHCTQCDLLLHGLFFQGYRCTNCRISLHRKCISAVRPCSTMGGTCSRSSPHGTSMPPPLPPPPTAPCLPGGPLGQHHHIRSLSATSDTINGVNGDFHLMAIGGDFIDEYPWYVGTMSRDLAQSLLEEMGHGSFLVRISPKQNGSYAISLNFNQQVKHIRICEGDRSYFLSSNKVFRSVVELVKWYQDHSLGESFHGLNVFLSRPCSWTGSLNLPSSSSVLPQPPPLKEPLAPTPTLSPLGVMSDQPISPPSPPGSPCPTIIRQGSSGGGDDDEQEESSSIS